MKKVLSLILLTALSLATFSCKKDDTVRVEYCELGIVLSEGFEPYDQGEIFNAAYSDGRTVVGIRRYSFVDCFEYGFLSTYTPEKFAKVYLDKFGLEASVGVQMHGDVPYFAYTNIDAGGTAYYYMPTFYCTPYAYFVITFITPASRQVEGRAEFLTYTSTVYILEEYI